MKIEEKIDPVKMKDKYDQLILDQLERIFSSVFFCRANQMQKFLNYIVLKTMRGETQQIKQYSIAVEGLCFPDDFNPDSNPVVRILCGRVRKRLRDYYVNNADDPLIISIPKGAYIAEFNKKDLAKTKGISAVSCGPKLALVCYTDVMQNVSSNRLVTRLGDYLAKVLSDTIFIRLVVFIPYGDKSDYTRSIESIKNNYDVDFVITLHTQEFPEHQNDLIYRFIDIHTEEIYRAESFRVGDDDQQVDEYEKIITLISTSLVDVNQGVIQINWSRKMLISKIDIPPQYQALVNYRYYLDNLCRETFQIAVSSCYGALQRNQDDIVANILLAGCCRHECSNGFGVIANPVKEGKKAAEAALHLKPHSFEAHFFLGQIQFSNNDWEHAIEEFEIARSINKYSSTIILGMSFYLCLMNRWDEGMSMANDNMDKLANYPSDYRLITFLNYFRQDKYEEALFEAKKLITPYNYHGPLSRCVSYIKLGQWDAAKKEQHELLARYPDFLENGQRYLTLFLVNKQYVNTIWATFLMFSKQPENV